MYSEGLAVGCGRCHPAFTFVCMKPVWMVYLLWVSLWGLAGVGDAAEVGKVGSAGSVGGRKLDGGTEVLREAARILELLPDQAGLGLPVQITGQVVYYDPDQRRCFLKQGTCGIQLVRPALVPPLELGAEVEVEGITQLDRHEILILEHSVRKLGMGPLPDPVALTVEQMVDVLTDSQWVRVESLVEAVERGAGDSLRLVLAGIRDTRVTIQGYPRDTPLPDDWVNSRLRFDGIWTSHVRSSQHYEVFRLFVPSTNQVQVLTRMGVHAAELPVRPIRHAKQFHAHAGESRLIRIRGIVTCIPRGSLFYLQDGMDGIRVHTRQNPGLKPGDFVEAVGFPSVDEAVPQIEEARVTRLSQGPIPTAVVLDAQAVGAGLEDYESTLVRIEGEVVGSVPHDPFAELVLKVGTHFVSATLTGKDAALALGRVRPQTRVELTGVCVGVPGNQAYYMPARILLQDVHGLRVLQEPPWWTVERVSGVLGSLALLLLLWRGLGWRKQLRSDRAYQQVFQTTSELMCLHSAEGFLLKPNPAWLRISGYSEAALKTQRVHDLVEASCRPGFEAWWSRVLAGETVEAQEFEILTASGQEVQLELRGQRMEETVRGASIQTQGRDTSLRSSSDLQRRRMAAIVECSDDAIISKTLGGVITSWNPAAEAMFGYTATEAIGQPLLMLFPPGMKHEEEQIMAAIQSGRRVEHIQTTRIRKDGRSVQISATISPILDGKGRIIGASKIARDISQQRRLEEQLLRAQRQQTVGTLANGIAHDLNNILAPFFLALPIFREELRSRTGRETLDLVAASLKRGADVVNQLLLFGRGGDSTRSLVDLSVQIKELGKLIEETFPKNISLHAAWPGDLLRVQANPTQLYQVLLNLAVNARDAMTSGGRLSIMAENLAALPSRIPGGLPRAAQPHVLVRVVDTGTGIQPEHLGRIFEPFYTTKDVGKGTGLGLSVVHGVVERHGGFVEVESCLGKGTEFRVYLPGTPIPATDVGRELAGGATRGQGERILVVDDEPSLLTNLCRLLEMNGYQTVAASNGAEALEILGSDAHGIQAILTDRSMPRMDGLAFAQTVRTRLKDVPIVLSTGVADTLDPAVLRVLGIAHVLHKPFKAEAVLELLSQLLRGRTRH